MEGAVPCSTDGRFGLDEWFRKYWYFPKALLFAELDRDWSHDMGEREEIRNYLHELIGDEGCGASCSDAEVYEDEDGWKLNMEGFMGPWRIGRTVAEARTSLKEYAHMGFGLA
jgi:hypothetical protein